MDYPTSRLELMMADLIDYTVITSMDKKGMSKFKPYPRPFKTKQPGQDRVRGTVMTLKDARVAYRIKKTTKTEEEIRELNKKFREMQTVRK